MARNRATFPLCDGKFPSRSNPPTRSWRHERDVQASNFVSALPHAPPCALKCARDKRLAHNAREKKDEENTPKPRSASEKEGNQEDPKTATDPMVSDLNDEFLDFEQCESQQPKEQEALPPVSEFTDTAEGNQNEHQTSDAKASQDRPGSTEKEIPNLQLDDGSKAASAVITGQHEQI